MALRRTQACQVQACSSQLELLRQQGCQARKHTSRTHTYAGDIGHIRQSRSVACQDEAGSAANVLLLHELQHGAHVWREGRNRRHSPDRALRPRRLPAAPHWTPPRSRAVCRPPRRSPKSMGLSGPPCFTPQPESRLSPRRPQTCTAYSASAYRASAPQPARARARPRVATRPAHNSEQGMQSYAPFRFRKQQESACGCRPPRPLSTGYCRVSTWCIVDRCGWKPACVGTRSCTASL